MTEKSIKHFARHRVATFNLDSNDIDFVAGTLSDLRLTLGISLDSPRKCEACGGLQPEIVFEYQGKRYRFTCTEILSTNDTVLHETDYEQLGEWCRHFRPQKKKAAASAAAHEG